MAAFSDKPVHTQETMGERKCRELEVNVMKNRGKWQILERM